jgi:hypothetical protein
MDPRLLRTLSLQTDIEKDIKESMLL